MKNFIVCGLAALATLTGFAQDRSINFAPETITVEELFAQAKASGKIIFLDCFTSWCGPCKMMARDVFTNNEVADFFNANFYNAKLDMEKEQGAILNKKYGITAYPTMLFIDPESRFIVHTVIGAHQPADLIAEAKKALDPALSMEKVKAAYEAGDKTPKTVNDYLTVLGKAHLSGLMNDVALDYVKDMDKEELAKPENWDIFARGIVDATCAPAALVMENRDFFISKIGADKVNGKLGRLLSMLAYPYTNSKAVGPEAAFDREGFDRVWNFIEKSGDASTPALLLQMKATLANQNGDYAGVIAALREDLEKKVLPERSRLFFNASNIARLTKIEDPGLRQEALKYLDDAVAGSANDLEKANFLRMKGIILQTYGQKEESDKAMAESIEYARRNAAAAGR